MTDRRVCACAACAGVSPQGQHSSTQPLWLMKVACSGLTWRQHGHCCGIRMEAGMISPSAESLPFVVGGGCGSGGFVWCRLGKERGLVIRPRACGRNNVGYFLARADRQGEIGPVDIARTDRMDKDDIGPECVAAGWIAADAGHLGHGGAGPVRPADCRLCVAFGAAQKAAILGAIATWLQPEFQRSLYQWPTDQRCACTAHDCTCEIVPVSPEFALYNEAKSRGPPRQRLFPAGSGASKQDRLPAWVTPGVIS